MVPYILPLLSVLLGIIFLGERFHWGAIIGVLLILSDITIVFLRPDLLTPDRALRRGGISTKITQEIG